MSTSLVCATSKTYLIKVKEGYIDKIIDFLREHGTITASFGPLVKAVYRDIPITIVKPNKVQVMLAYSNVSLDELVQDFMSVC